jgi:hypothetical protein
MKSQWLRSTIAVVTGFVCFRLLQHLHWTYLLVHLDNHSSSAHAPLWAMYLAPALELVPAAMAGAVAALVAKSWPLLVAFLCIAIQVPLVAVFSGPEIQSFVFSDTGLNLIFPQVLVATLAGGTAAYLAGRLTTRSSGP